MDDNRKHNSLGASWRQKESRFVVEYHRRAFCNDAHDSVIFAKHSLRRINDVPEWGTRHLSRPAVASWMDGSVTLTDSGSA